MSIDNLRALTPAYAKDQKLNIGTILRSNSLTEQQLWGTLVASAAATRNRFVLEEILEDAKEHLSEEAINAAYGSAAVMAMNNVAYRARHWLPEEDRPRTFGLRMNIISKPGITEKVDFELWSLAVSSINGCEACVTAHNKEVRELGLGTDQVWDAIRIASTVQALAQVAVIEGKE